MSDSDKAAEAATAEYYESLKQDELSHALDHVLSYLDLEPWDDYKNDPDFVKFRIKCAIDQIKYIQDKMLV